MIEKYDGKKYTLKEYLPVIFLFIFLLDLQFILLLKKENLKMCF